MRVKTEIVAGARGELDLVDSPSLARLRIAAHFRRREGVERIVIGRIDGDELPLEMGGEFGDDDSMLGGGALQFIAIGPALRRLAQVYQTRVPGSDLDAPIAERSRPAADRIESVERRLVADELREEDGGSLDRFHSFPPVLSLFLSGLRPLLTQEIMAELIDLVRVREKVSPHAGRRGHAGKQASERLAYVPTLVSAVLQRLESRRPGNVALAWRAARVLRCVHMFDRPQIWRDHANRILLLDVGVEGVIEHALILLPRALPAVGGVGAPI